MTTNSESDRPGGDLTDHGADPAERENDSARHGDEKTPDGGGHGGSTAGEVTPAGDLTDHGVDPSSRD